MSSVTNGKAMTGKERIQALFDGSEPDKAPVMHISFSSRVASHILGRDAHVGGHFSVMLKNKFFQKTECAVNYLRMNAPIRSN